MSDVVKLKDGVAVEASPGAANLYLVAGRLSGCNMDEDQALLIFADSHGEAEECFERFLRVDHGVGEKCTFIGDSQQVGEMTVKPSTKHCRKCGSEMVGLRNEDKKVCSNGACKHEVHWPLEDGQEYMFKRNVEPLREAREVQL